MAEPELPRDRGLVRGIGTTALAAGVVNAVVGAGVFTLPAVVAQQAGAYASLTYLLCGLVMAGIVVAFADAGSRVPTSGGAYGTVAAALGPAAGFVTGMLLVVSDILASGGIAAALADLAGAVAPVLASPVARAAELVALYAVIAGLNLLGVGLVARLVAAATVIKLAPLAVFLVVAAISLGAPAPPGVPMPPQDFGEGLILTLFAFTGMETALGASGEVRSPNRTLPRALMLAMALILALYLSVQAGAAHLLGPALAHAPAPLAEAAARVSLPASRLVLAGGGVSMLAYLIGDVLGTSRMLFAMSRDRVLPAWLSALDARTKVPVRAVFAYTALCAAVASTGSFTHLLVLSSLAVVGVYMLGCYAAVVLRRRGVALAGAPLGWRIVPAAASIGLLGMVGMLVVARDADLAGLAAVVAVSLLVSVARGRAALP